MLAMNTQRMRLRAALFPWLILTTLPFCQSPDTREAPDSSERNTVKITDAVRRPEARTVLLQVQGLAGAWVERWLSEGRFLEESTAASAQQVREGGLARLARGAHSMTLRPVEPTLAAPNLASMLTGHTPRGHGVIGNSYLDTGRRVSGFTARMAAPPLWEIARRKGLRVVTWLALGTRCQEPSPTGLLALCHPGAMGTTHARPAVAVSLCPSGVLSLGAPTHAPGRARVDLLVHQEAPGRVRLELPPGVTLVEDATSVMEPGDSRGILWDGEHPLSRHPPPRRLSWITLTDLAPRGRRALFHDGGTSLILAAPGSFARRLEGLGLHRPADADGRSLVTGRISPELFAQTALREMHALVRFARWLGRGDRFDLAVISVVAVSALARHLLAPPSRPELTRGETARHRAALEASLRAIDRELALLLDALDLSRTRVILASDHGLVPVSVDVSLMAPLSKLHPGVRVLSDGAAAWVHLPDGVPEEEAVRALEALRIGGKPVFEGGRILRGEALGGAGLPAMGQSLLCQARPGVSLSGRRRKRVAGWPSAMAEKGHLAELPDMQGVFLASGPGLRHLGALGPMDITWVAALMAQAAELPPPGKANTDTPALWTAGGGPSVEAPVARALRPPTSAETETRGASSMEPPGSHPRFSGQNRAPAPGRTAAPASAAAPPPAGASDPGSWAAASPPPQGATGR